MLNTKKIEICQINSVQCMFTWNGSPFLWKAETEIALLAERIQISVSVVSAAPSHSEMKIIVIKRVIQEPFQAIIY